MSYRERDKLLRELGYDSYAEYLVSPLWKAIRERILSSRRKCLICFDKAQVLHHVNYCRAVLLGEDSKPLKPLCNRCHAVIEFEGGRKLTLSKANDKLFRLVRSPWRKRPHPKYCHCSRCRRGR